MIAGGSVLLGLGLIASGFSGLYAQRAVADGDQQFGISRGVDGAVALAFGVPAILMLAGGGVLLGLGIRRHQRYRAATSSVRPSIAPTRGGAVAGLVLNF
jgi:hypothetical protein